MMISRWLLIPERKVRDRMRAVKMSPSLRSRHKSNRFKPNQLLPLFQKPRRRKPTKLLQRLRPLKNKLPSLKSPLLLKKLRFNLKLLETSPNVATKSSPLFLQSPLRSLSRR